MFEPLAEVASAPGPSARLVEPLPLLIVDDEVTLHHGYLRLLTQRGLAGECVGSGAEALAANTALRERAVLLERLENRNHELAEQVVEDGAVALRFRRRWDVALHAISDPLLVIGPGLRIEGANRAAATMAAARRAPGL